MCVFFNLSESTSTATLQTQNGLAVRTILSFWTGFFFLQRLSSGTFFFFAHHAIHRDTNQQNPFPKTVVLSHPAILLNISPRDALNPTLWTGKYLYFFLQKKKKNGDCNSRGHYQHGVYRHRKHFTVPASTLPKTCGLVLAVTPIGKTTTKSHEEDSLEFIVTSQLTGRAVYFIFLYLIPILSSQYTFL